MESKCKLVASLIKECRADGCIGQRLASPCHSWLDLAFHFGNERRRHMHPLEVKGHFCLLLLQKLMLLK